MPKSAKAQGLPGLASHLHPLWTEEEGLGWGRKASCSSSKSHEPLGSLDLPSSPRSAKSELNWPKPPVNSHLSAAHVLILSLGLLSSYRLWYLKPILQPGLRRGWMGWEIYRVQGPSQGARHPASQGLNNPQISLSPELFPSAQPCCGGVSPGPLLCRTPRRPSYALMLRAQPRYQTSENTHTQPPAAEGAARHTGEALTGAKARIPGFASHPPGAKGVPLLPRDRVLWGCAGGS